MKHLGGTRTRMADVDQQMEIFFADTYRGGHDVQLSSWRRTFQGVLRLSISGRRGRVPLAGVLRHFPDGTRESFTQNLEVWTSSRDFMGLFRPCVQWFALEIQNLDLTSGDWYYPYKLSVVSSTSGPFT